jgi:hypothetical protein
MLAFLEKPAGVAELTHPVAASAEQVSTAGHKLGNLA